MGNSQNRTRKQETGQGSIISGFVPPSAKEMEKAVLGAVMMFGESWDLVAGILTADAFYVDSHKEIFRAMKKLAENHQPIDILTVNDRLTKDGKIEMVGGVYYVTSLTNNVVNPANLIAHSRIVLQKYIHREIIRVAANAIGSAYEEGTDPLDLLNEVNNSFAKLNDLTSVDGLVTMDKVVMDALTEINRNVANSEKTGGITGVPTGFKEINRATRGYQPGDLIYIAARPSVGKTAFALNTVRAAAEHFKGVGGSIYFASLEMKAVRLVLRMLSAESGEMLSRIQTGMLSDQQMKNVFEKGAKPLANLPIFMDDAGTLTIQSLKSKARRLKKKHNLGMIVIDYLQLMSGDSSRGKNREQEVSEMSRGLKQLAQELSIPIISLSQLSREVEKRNNPKPMLSDLRESGSIEQDADLVMFLWKPSDAEMMSDMSLQNTRYFAIAKQRDGYLIDGKLQFQDDIQKFVDGDGMAPPKELPSGWRPIIND